MKFDAPAADEYALIYDSWARSFKKSPWAGCIPNHLYDQVSRAAMNDILNRGARVIVAVEELETGGRRVLGYSVSEPAHSILHWLFMKRDARGLGLGRQLLAETVADWKPFGWRYTHRTNASTRFLGQSFSWDPVSARVKS